jgi:putative ABC transport system permease protein
VKLIISGLANGLGEIWAHKLRSLLTICCVLLGVSSMVLTTGFMEGIFRTWGQSLEEQGGIEKITGSPKSVQKRQEPFAAISRGFTLSDEVAIRRLIPEVAELSPEIDHKTRFTHSDKSHDGRVQGVKNDIFVINRYAVAEGRMLSDLDQHDAAHVIIIGHTLRRRLFEDGEPALGRWLNVDRVPFQVVGVLENYEQFYGTYNTLNWKNDIAFMPITTMSKKIKRTDQLAWFNLKPRDISRLREVVDGVANVLAQQHRGILDFEVRTNEQALASFSKTKASFVIGGSAIAGVSLLVSGIGIMNLMLASINERVREIGIRKALGATPLNIFAQFVAEAVTLSLLGGVAGVAVAVVAIHGLAAVLPPGNAPVLTSSSFIVGFVFSVVAGVLAGVYPAMQAAKLDPIEALRYE